MTNNSRRRKIIGIVLSILIVVFCNTTYFKSLTNFPNEIRIVEGETKKLNIFFPFDLSVKSESPNNPLLINGKPISDNKLSLNLNSPVNIKSDTTGKVKLHFSIMGILPFKKVVVNVLPKVTAIPGGHSIGVKLKSKGVIVVGFAPVFGKNGVNTSPAEQAGIRMGDTILQINGRRVENPEQVNKIINESEGKPLLLKIKRHNTTFSTVVRPKFDKKEGNYQIGIWIRDVAAGVGTLTFCLPEEKYYGALGHIITDMDTGKPIEIENGEIIKAKIAAIQKGIRNKPGEKKGVFLQQQKVLGDILKNTHYGIFGKLKEPLNNPLYKNPIPVALISEVHEGPAKILTVIKDDKIQEFNVVIEKVYRQTSPRPKGLIIRITDKRLLDETGGIIQGMSGSPIIQNNKLVGAVTHVFVNDPTRGYGVFLEWMLQMIQNIEEDEFEMAAGF